MSQITDCVAIHSTIELEAQFQRDFPSGASDKQRRPKASDITDQQIYDLVAQAKHLILGQTTWAIMDGLSEFPQKVVLAKLRQMENKGRIFGCGCGCRGDWTVEKR